MSMNISGNTGDMNRESLAEIARMAYGHRVTEGTGGGNGNIGVLVTANGTTRVIKFNTHRAERKAAGDPTDHQITSANNLRGQLLQIARSYGVNEATMGRIRENLGLSATGAEEQTRSLLERKIVAKVVKMIDRDIWAHALKDVDMTKYSSANVDTDYKFVVGTVRDPGGNPIRDTVFLKTLTDATNDELRAFGAFASANDIYVDPKLGTTIHQAVVKAVRYRMKQPPNGTDAEKCRNLVRNVVVLSLLAWNREDDALRYINAHVDEADRKGRLEDTAFKKSASAMRWLWTSIRTCSPSRKRTAIDLAVEKLVTDKDGVVTDFFGNTAGGFADSDAALAGPESKSAFQGKSLTETQGKYVDFYATREKGAPLPSPVSTDEQTKADVKSVKNVIGKGPKTVAFTPQHVDFAKSQIEDSANDAIGNPGKLHSNLGQVNRDMAGGFQMIYGGRLSIHPSQPGVQTEIDAVRTDLEQVFTREDGTVDNEALMAFASFAHQGLNSMVYLDHALQHSAENEFPVMIMPSDRARQTKPELTTIRLDRGCEPGSYRVTFNYVMKGEFAQVLVGGNQKPIKLDPNDAGNFVRYDCTFDFKIVNGKCDVSFPEIPTVSLNLNKPQQKQ